jgi:hypothetical protein
VQEILEAELRAQGATDAQLVRTGSELETVDAALDWAEAGDLVLLIVHAHRDEVVERLRGAAS